MATTVKMEAGEKYVVYVPDEGWILCKYENSYLKSIDSAGNDLKVYRNFKSETDTVAAQLVLNPSTAGLVICRLYNESAVTNPAEAAKRASTKLVIPRGSAEMQAILTDPMAMVLYNTIASMFPFLDCMGTLVEATQGAQLSSQRAMLNKSQKAAQTAAQVQEMVDKVRDSFFFKMLKSPAFAIFLIVFAVILTVLAAIATVLTGGAATALWVAIVVIIVVVVAVVTTMVAVSASNLNSELTAMENKFGDAADPAVKKAFQDLRNMVGTTAAVVVVVVILIALVSVLAGYLAIKGPSGSNAQIDQKNQQNAEQGKGNVSEAEAGSLHVGSICNAAGGSATGAAGAMQGVLSISEGMYQKAMAPLVELYSVMQAQIKEWDSHSKYFGSILKHLQDGLKSVWDYIEKMLSTQSSLIQSIGDTSMTIVRNMSI
ncbi:MAG: hypothetical protein LBT98_04455 [Puniceicoccales bacterium]|jgi:hypothetical protein|nr:hypothetical protein [Puniceicoccales bacterium]